MMIVENADANSGGVRAGIGFFFSPLRERERAYGAVS
jgi:hypothetical protein